MALIMSCLASVQLLLTIPIRGMDVTTMNDVSDAVALEGPRRRPGDPTSRAHLPLTLPSLILQAGVRHQAALVVLTVIVFLIELVPLELQRRIVNDVVGKRDLQLLVLLCAAYAALVLVHGALKLGLNVYRSWVGEKTTRQLRRHIGELIDTTQNIPRAHMTSGTSVSLMLAEVDPIGAFVGGSVSEPLLQAGILLTVFGYMITLQPFVALITLA